MADDRTCLTPASEAWMAGRPASAAVGVGDLLFLSGQGSVTDDGRVTDAGDVEAQTRNAFARVGAVLEAAGAGIDDVLDVMTFHKDPRTMDAVFAVGREVFSAPYPAWTALGMVGAHDPGLEVVVRVVAQVGAGEKQGVTPAGFGWMEGLPLSAACRKGDYLFTSGIVAADDGGN
ncbi:MAG: Rid family hydrolase, partial [Rhodospirillales bacterium]|nr:Rid family hydrolase [Rhodospirillales bacterium]